MTADVEVLNSQGGAGKAITSLRRYVNDLKKSGFYSDLIVAVVDANSHGVAARKRDLDRILGDLGSPYVLAIPDPHIEAWYLADPCAIAGVFGETYEAEVPTGTSHQHADFKAALIRAFEPLGFRPPAGGTEYGEDIAKILDDVVASRKSPSFNAFWSELRGTLRLAASTNAARSTD